MDAMSVNDVPVLHFKINVCDYFTNSSPELFSTLQLPNKKRATANLRYKDILCQRDYITRLRKGFTGSTFF